MLPESTHVNHPQDTRIIHGMEIVRLDQSTRVEIGISQRQPSTRVDVLRLAKA